MEADGGEELVNRSEILKNCNSKFLGVIGDDDTDIIKKFRDNNDPIVHKLSDRNHIKKKFGKRLYEM